MSSTVVLQQYNDLWRRQRQMLNAWLNPRSVTQFHELLEHQAQSLLLRLLNVAAHPKSFECGKQDINL